MACGLIAVTSSCEVPLPLHTVHVDVLIVRTIAETTLTQLYKSDRQEPVDAKYVFPIPDTAAVTTFVATFADGHRVTSVIKEKEQARAEFVEATKRGQRAALLEEKRSDILEVSIGRLGAGEEVTISVMYCTELPVDHDALRLTIPSHVAPRYAPKSDRGAAETMDLLMMQPPSDASFAADVVWEAGEAGISKISSPTHASLLQCQAVIEADVGSVKLAGGRLETDVVLLLHPRDLWKPCVAWEEWSGTQALLLTFVPKFELPRIKAPEVMFIVDCSGSMRGRRIEQAKAALKVCLRLLPLDCGFNIIKFGNDFDHFSTVVVQSSDKNRARAAAYIEDLDADMGGTEMLKPLRFALEGSSDGRQIIFITDGKVTNEQDIIDLVRGRSGRVFALGLGSGVSTFLINGVARASSGYAAYVQDGENLEPVCVSLLQKALSPAVTNLSISWPAVSQVTDDDFILVDPVAKVQRPELSFFDPAQRHPNAYRPEEVLCGTGNDEIQRAPNRPPPIFAGAGFQSFALYPKGRGPAKDGCIEVKGNSAAGPLCLRLQLPAEPTERASGLVHRLAARALIRDLEEGDAVEAAAPRSAESLSLHFSVLCRSTAFIAIDERDGSQRGTPEARALVEPSSSTPESKIGRSSSFSSRKLPRQERIVQQVTGHVSWRAEATRYKKNELFIDFIEQLSLLVSTDGTVLVSDVEGQVRVKAFLSGFPEMKLALNDKLDPKENSLEFHQSVRLSRYDLDRCVSCIPPDGEFTLMRYKMRQVRAPLQMKAMFTNSLQDDSVIDLDVHVKSLFKGSAAAHTIEMNIPLAAEQRPQQMQVSLGDVKYCKETSCIRWRVRQLYGQKDITLTAKCARVKADGRPKEPPEILVTLLLPSVLASGLELRSLKVIEKSGYTATTNVRYLTQCQDSKFRMPVCA
mmetsp:Transcript_2198/g.5595  ORF Transcript_2198/g.5595 Transcript_2198/m.5595 type:complete len:918 (-) Transcript_2198:46-2799(-)